MTTAPSQKTDIRTWLRNERTGLWLYLLVASAITANIVMRQISGMLGRVEAGGLSNTMSVLTAPQLRVDPIREAGTAWSGRTPDGQVLEVAQAVTAALISWHTYIDFVFVAAYAVLLGWLLVRVCQAPPEGAGSEETAPNATQRVARTEPPGEAVQQATGTTSTSGTADNQKPHTSTVQRVKALLQASWEWAPWAWRFLGALVVADLVENVLTLNFAALIAAEEDPGSLAWALLVVTLVKWLALAALALDVAGFLLAAAEARAGTVPADPASKLLTRLGNAAGGATLERRIWRRHRVQIGAVVILGVLVALPAGGPLDQIPDILRTYADTDDVRVAEYAWSIVTLGLLCLALWVAGRWALLDGAVEKKARNKDELATRQEQTEPVTEEATDGRAVGTGDEVQPPGVTKAIQDRWPGPRPLHVLLGALGLWGLTLLLFCTEPWAFRFNGGVFALPAVLTVLSALWWPLGRERGTKVNKLARPEAYGSGRASPYAAAHGAGHEQGEITQDGDPVLVPGKDRESVRRAGRLLAALPIAIAGLGLVRAFVDPLIAYPLTGLQKQESWILLGLAITAVLLMAPLFYAALTAAERLLLQDKGDPASVRTGAQNAIGAVVLVVTVALAGLAAWDPVTWGPRLNATGSVSVVLALGVLLGGALQWLAERQAPYAPFRRLGLRERTPFFAVLAVTFALAGLFNVQGGYHALRVEEPANNAAEALDLDTTFDDWFAQASDSCIVEGTYAPDGGAAVPLVIVAAPGGGIRAAYWTDHALQALRQGTACDGRVTFAASGVSGGSVGLMTHYLRADDDPLDDDLVTDMSRERALAASVAAMVFRDLPAAVLGVSTGWQDRGAVIEDAWAESDGAWSATHLIRDLAPGETLDGWRPLLLLNGTEVSTGCRLVVSPRQVVASGAEGAPRSCRSAAVADEEHGIVEGAVDLHWFRDEQACDDDSVRGGDLRAASAALLSARFPYVSPSAELFRCTGEEGEARRAADLDGGAAENSGLATALDLWEALEPIVSEHNETAVRCREDERASGCEHAADEPVVVPMLVLVDNHYASSALATPVGRQRELSAPVGLLSADGVLATQSVLEQEALVTFSGAAPGLPDDGDAQLRYFRVAPVVRPGLAAPLGWTLSDLTRDDLGDQLEEAMKKPCTIDDDGMRRPAAPACYLAAVGSPDPAA